MQQILIVEDDQRIRRELTAELTAHGFGVATAAGLEPARRILREAMDLVLLDLGLPDGDGLTLCREMRALGDDRPVVILSARDAPGQRVQGLDAGADDYVVKPFDMGEVLARVRSSLRRSQGGFQRSVFRSGELWLDATARSAGRGDLRFELPQMEFELLRFLLRHPGRTWTRDQLLEGVWRISGGVGDSRTIDQHIRRLRKKIEPVPASPRYITTVWGVGYRMEDRCQND